MWFIQVNVIYFQEGNLPKQGGTRMETNNKWGYQRAAKSISMKIHLFELLLKRVQHLQRWSHRCQEAFCLKVPNDDQTWCGCFIERNLLLLAPLSFTEHPFSSGPWLWAWPNNLVLKVSGNICSANLHLCPFLRFCQTKTRPAVGMLHHCSLKPRELVPVSARWYRHTRNTRGFVVWLLLVLQQASL